MFDKENVPPVRSAVLSLPAEPRACKRISSEEISKTLSDCTFLTFGTSRPEGVSMATPILCEACGRRKVKSKEVQHHFLSLNFELKIDVSHDDIPDVPHSTVFVINTKQLVFFDFTLELMKTSNDV